MLEAEAAIVRLKARYARFADDGYDAEGIASLFVPDGVRDGKQAVEHATRACELTNWKDPARIATLAAAHAEAVDFERAVEFQTKALSFPEYEKRFGKVGRERLQLYDQQKPYRDPALARREAAPPPWEVRR